MKLRLLLAAGLLLPVWLVPDRRCSKISAGPSPVPSRSAAIAPTPAPDLFTSSVRPILVNHCAPCHEPGGVMYERLPFDRSEVLASHSPGVLRRIKAPDERAAIERWLATQPKS